MKVDQQRYTVYGTAANPLEEAKEIGADIELSARIFAAGLMTEGRDVYIYDCVGNKRITLSGEKVVMQ